jgi:endonuclease YncB( thermonuclease family)
VLAVALALLWAAGVAHAKRPAKPRMQSVAAARVQGQTVRGRVVKVLDGDTVEVLLDGGPLRVRLWGIDAPEKAQPFGQAAKQHLTRAVGGQEVQVEVRSTDRYGRAVGWILRGTAAVNLDQVRAGMAWWYQQYAQGHSGLQQAESAARQAKAGLWQLPDPQPPWLFRKARRGGR